MLVALLTAAAVAAGATDSPPGGGADPAAVSAEMSAQMSVAHARLDASAQATAVAAGSPPHTAGQVVTALAPAPPAALAQVDSRAVAAKARPAPKPQPKPRPQSAPAPAERKVRPVGGLTQQQMDHAAVIVAIGQRAGLPKRAYVVALATALQETYLRNLANPAYPQSMGMANDGVGQDHDSVGLFQQRPSTGWGSVSQIMDPAYSATKFYEALARVPGWQDLPVTVAAQRVQISAFPDHYAKHEPLAREIVDALT